jgi:hypothetical protein
VPPERFVDDEEAVEAGVAELASMVASSLKTRRQWLESLTPEGKANLAAQAKRFDELQRIPGEQDRLRKLQRDISEAEDAMRLQKTLLAYDKWLSRLSAGERQQLRDDLQDLSPEEQVERVQRIMRRQSVQASHRLTPEDAEKLRKEILAIAETRQADILRELRQRGDGARARRLEGPRGALTLLSWELQNDDAKNEIRERLVRQLSPEARDHLESLGGWRRRLQLWQWVRDSLQPKLGPEELERFFVEKLDNKQRERLLSLPPGEMQAQLERLYFASEFGVRDPQQWWNEFRESGGPRNPPARGEPGFPPIGPLRERGRPDGRPPRRLDGDRMPRGLEGPPGPRRDDRPDGRRPPDGPGAPPPDGAPRQDGQETI